MFLTEGSNFTRMKNKYLTRSLCVTILSAMVLSSPMSVMAADEHIETASDLGDGSGEVISDGSDTPAPEPNTPAPEPDTPAPEPDTPTPEPDTPTPEPDTPTPEPTSSQPVQQSQKPANAFGNVMDFLPIVFIGAGLFWFRQKNRRGGPKG